METRAPQPTDALDHDEFYDQYNLITKNALDAIDGGDVQIVAGYMNELALLCVANPRHAHGLETRREADAEL